MQQCCILVLHPARSDSQANLTCCGDNAQSGIPNFLAVALVLNDLGYKVRGEPFHNMFLPAGCGLFSSDLTLVLCCQPIGIRLDSGDLAYLSKEARRAFVEVCVNTLLFMNATVLAGNSLLSLPPSLCCFQASEEFGVDFKKLTIVASNDINEPVLHSLNAQGHEIDAFGIGTNLVCPGCSLAWWLGVTYIGLLLLMLLLLLALPVSTRSLARPSQRWAWCTSSWRRTRRRASSCHRK